MTVFIAHAPQDKAAAESLAEKLRQRAFLVELDTGEGAMRPLAASDAVIGLISRDFVFSPFKLRLEKRLLDAWADNQLLQVKLDHSFAPVGLRDLPTIDASFEAQRDFTWNKVADAVRALRQNPFGNAVDMHSDMRAGRGSRDGRDYAGPDEPMMAEEQAPPPMASAPAPVEWQEQQTGYIGGGGDYAKYDRAPPMARKRAATKSGKGLGLALLLTLFIGGGVGIYFALFGAQAPQSTPSASTSSDQPANPTPPPDYPHPADAASGLQLSQPLIMAAAIIVGLLIMTLIAISVSRKTALERKMGKPSKGANAGREVAASAPNYSVAPPLKEQGSEPLVFISYARADQTSVDPLAKAVKDSGHAIWIDTDEINAGTSWAGEIVRAIKSAGHVLIMCSPRSFESDQVKREVYLADRYKKPLMPVFLEAAEPPEDFEYFFAGVQWLRLHEAPEADRAAILTRALPAA